MKKFGGKTVVVVLVLLSLLATACTNGGNGKGGEEGSTAPTGSPEGSKQPAEVVSGDAFAKYDPPIVVRSVREVGPNLQFKQGESIDDNIWTRAYRDELGITVEYDWIVASDYKQKLNVTIVSGNLPDIFQVDGNTLTELVNAGLIEDLTAVYEGYATPLTKEVMTSDGPYALQSATFDDKIMGIPLVLPTVDAAPVLWIRQDWLDKLQLPEPTTMQDLIAISEAFVQRDPDENGLDDTTGLALHNELIGGYASLDGFFAGYHAYPEFWLKNDAGELVYGGIQPEVKEALVKLQEMYKAGHFDREFAAKDMAKSSELMAAGKNGMHFGQMWNPLFPMGASYENDNAVWKAYPLVSIDGLPAKAGIPSTNAPSYYVVRKGYEHPEALMKFLGLFYKMGFDKETDPALYAKFFIDEGVETGGYSLVQGGPPLVDLEIHQNYVKAVKEGDTSFLSPREKVMYDNIMRNVTGEGSTTDWGYDMVFGEQSAFTVIDSYNTNQHFQRNEYFGTPTASMIERNPTLETMQLEVFTRIIMGESPDSFDTFVEQWKRLGGDQITGEVNEWYKANHE